MTMDQVNGCNGGPGSGVNSKVSTPTPGGPAGVGGLNVLEDDEGSDIEVMQVVSEALNLRIKKEGQGVNDDLNRERPMSWEGELSEDGEDEMNHGDPPALVTSEAPVLRPPGSPMCIMEKEEHPLIVANRDSHHRGGTTLKSIRSREASPITLPIAMTPTNSGVPCGVIGVVGNVTAAFTANSPSMVGRASFTASGQSSPFPTERPNNVVGGPSPFETSLANHRSPAQSRHLVNFSGPYSQSPSPVLNRPTSSCSSRSSYSPTQSPLLGRHLTASASSAYSHTQSPVLSRHAAGTSSDGSVYSPTSSPLQGRHLSIENGGSLYSPAQSPSQIRHHVAVVVDSGISTTSGGHTLVNGTNSLLGSVTPNPSATFSPSQSPAHFRAGSAPCSILSRPIPFGASPSPTPSSTSLHQHHRSAAGTPDQIVTTSIENGHGGGILLGNHLNTAATNHLHLQQQHQQQHVFGSQAPVDHGEAGRISQTQLHQPTVLDCRSTASSASVVSSASDESNASDFSSPSRRLSVDNTSLSEDGRAAAALAELSSQSPSSGGQSVGQSTSGGNSGISRQQLLSGPCPICGDRISGFHYGIFSCESCKGFFKRTVQNKKNYVCLRGAKCTITISTRKKCPACRFDKCLKTGMKLEAIREDRTRGGRSTYQCSYTLATQSLNDGRISSSASDSHFNHSGSQSGDKHNDSNMSYMSHSDSSPSRPSGRGVSDSGIHSAEDEPQGIIPPLMQEILAVEHLWHYTDREVNRLSEQQYNNRPGGGANTMGAAALGAMGMGLAQGQNNDFISNLCNIADHRLYKIVKWCKSLPLFREIEIDDQIALLINSWCELLLLSCCYRSMGTPQEIRVSMGKSMNLEQARALGLGPVIERMLNLTEHMRRLQVDQYEYVCLKVIILLTSDVSGLKEPDKVGVCQKQVLEAMQTYTRTHYPHQPSKFGELLLRIPELERACQVGKESLASKQKAGEMPTFNLLMELLRGDH